MQIKFEPSGTHIHKDQLKIRLDFYPDESDKSYSSHYIEIINEKSDEFQKGYQGKLDSDGQPIDQDDYNKWFESLPKVWTITPCLCHFITVKPDITQSELDSLVKSMFPGGVTATIDDYIIQSNSSHFISPYMRDKSQTTLTKMWDDSAKMTSILSEMVTKGVLTALEASSLAIAKTSLTVKEKVDAYVTDKINTTLSNYSVVSQTGGTKEDTKPQSIDVGSEAIDRPSATSNNTLINLNNAANTTGILDVVEVFLSYRCSSNGKVGTVYLVSGTNYSTRDYETIGAMAEDSKQTYTGLSIDVTAGDFIGIDQNDGQMEITTSGGSGVRGSASSIMPFTNTSLGSIDSDGIISIYATGTESGGTYSYTSTIAMGVSVAATRTATIGRTSSTKFGISISAFKSFWRGYTSSVAFGIKSLASRSVVTSRTASVAFGIKTTALRLIQSIRTSPVSVGVSSSASRLVEVVRTSSAAVGISTTASRLAQIIRTSSVNLGISAAASRMIETVRTSSVKIGVSATASRLVEVLRTAGISLGVAVDAVMSFISGGATYIYESLVSFGVSVNASKVVQIIRTSPVAMGIKSTASRLVEVGRAASVVIGESVTAARQANILRTSSVAVGIKSTASRTVSVLRTSVVSFGISVSAYVHHGAEYVYTSAVAFGVAVSSSRLVQIARTATVKIGISSLATRTVEIFRAAQVVIGESVDASRSLAITRTANVAFGIQASVAFWFHRILKIFSTLSTALGITSSKSTGLNITSTISTGLTITSTLEAH